MMIRNSVVLFFVCVSSVVEEKSKKGFMNESP